MAKGMLYNVTGERHEIQEIIYSNPIVVANHSAIQRLIRVNDLEFVTTDTIEYSFKWYVMPAFIIYWLTIWARGLRTRNLVLTWLEEDRDAYPSN